MKPTWFFRSLLITAVGLAASVSTAYELLPGAVADSSMTTVYLMRPAGGIEAVRITDGRAVWNTTRADVPLAIDGTRLLAQRDTKKAGGLELVLFDRAAGTARDVSVELPEGIFARVNETMGNRFTVTATIDGTQALVRWQNLTLTTRRDVIEKGGGAAPTTTEGAARIDLVTGVAAAIPLGEVPDAAGFAPTPARDAYARGELAGPPVKAGPVVAATMHSSRGGWPVPELSLLRWDATTGAALPALQLSSDSYVFHRFSGAGSTLLVCEQDPGSSVGYTWILFDAASGLRLGSVRSDISTPRHILASGMIVHERPTTSKDDRSFSRQLASVSLSDGRSVWTRPLRVTQYLGPQAP